MADGVTIKLDPVLKVADVPDWPSIDQDTSVDEVTSQESQFSTMSPVIVGPDPMAYMPPSYVNVGAVLRNPTNALIRQPRSQRFALPGQPNRPIAARPWRRAASRRHGRGSEKIRPKSIGGARER